MMFKNSLKLLAGNFSTVWKLMLYYLVVVGIAVGLLYPVYGSLSSALNQNGTLTALFDTVTSFNISSNIFTLLSPICEGFVALFDTVIVMFSSNTFEIVYTLFILFYFVPFMFGLAEIPVGETLFGYMSSLTKYGFAHSFIRKFGKSVLLQLFKTLIMLPINLFIIAVFVAIFKLSAIGGVMIYFLPFILIGVTCILVALKISFFSGWIPAMVVYGCNMFSAMKRGFKAVFRKFSKIFSTALIMTIIVFAINYFFGIFAFPVTIPATMMLFFVFEMVVYFTSQGMRFYVDLDTIVSPKLLEESDSFKNLKDII